MHHILIYGITQCFILCKEMHKWFSWFRGCECLNLEVFHSIFPAFDNDCRMTSYAKYHGT